MIDSYFLWEQGDIPFPQKNQCIVHSPTHTANLNQFKYSNVCPMKPIHRINGTGICIHSHHHLPPKDQPDVGKYTIHEILCVWYCYARFIQTNKGSLYPPNTPTRFGFCTSGWLIWQPSGNFWVLKTTPDSMNDGGFPYDAKKGLMDPWKMVYLTTWMFDF